jgi:hypothetical protein
MIQFLNVLFGYISKNPYINKHPVIGWLQIVLFGVFLFLVCFEVGVFVLSKIIEYINLASLVKLSVNTIK